MNLLHSCNLTLYKNSCKTQVHVHMHQPGPAQLTCMKIFLSYRLKCMVLTSWFPDLICTGPGSESGTETMQLLFSQHNIACTWLQVQHFFFLFLQHQQFVTRATIVPSKQIPKVFFRLAHITSARRIQNKAVTSA